MAGQTRSSGLSTALHVSSGTEQQAGIQHPHELISSDMTTAMDITAGQHACNKNMPSNLHNTTDYVSRLWLTFAITTTG